MIIRDVAGNVTTASRSFTVDRTPPTVTVALADDTGSPSSDEITSDPSLSGSGDPNAAVHFTVDGTPVATTVTADGTGHWTFVPSGLADGSHTIVASETDAAGNVGISSALNFVLDATPPALDYLLLSPTTQLSVGGGVTINTNTFTAAGYARDSEPSTQVQVFATPSGGGTPILVGSRTVDASDNFSIATSSLADGTYNFSVTATDIAGNVSTEVGPFGVTIDTIPPTVSITSTGGLTNQASQTVSGTVLSTEAAPGATVTLYDNGAQIGTAPVTNGSWSTGITLAGDGSHGIVAKDTDAAGNTGSSTPLVFTLDTVAPTVTISTSGGLTNQASQTISGTVLSTEAAPGATVTLYDNGVQIGAAPVTNGSWSTGITLAGDGTHNIVAKDIDAAGNIGSSTPVLFTLAMGDQYVWVGPILGSWDVAGNWDDTTAGLNPAAVPPGGNDNVTINAAGSSVQVISGTGNAASLTVHGSTSLAGEFTTAILTTLGDGDTLEIATNGNLTVGAAESVVGSGSIQLDGGTLTDTAGITLAGTNDGAAPTLSGFGTLAAPLTVVGNALVQLNGGTLTDGSGITFSQFGYLKGHGTVAAPLSGGPGVGFILATNGTLELASTVNVHTLELGDNNNSSGEVLKLDAASTTEAVEFNGAGQTLEIAPGGSLTIGGFNIFNFSNGADVQALVNGTINSTAAC